VKETCGQDFLTVTPGIRFAGSAADDQARITTPEKARLGGSDFIVVGRPVTQARTRLPPTAAVCRDFYSNEREVTPCKTNPT
jgi:orotidine-5'-phosphate decarboxylase